MPRFVLLPAAVSLLSLVPWPVVLGQQAAAVSAGQRVRVVTVRGDRFTGKLLARAAADTLVIARSGSRPAEIKVARDQLTELYVSRGGRPRGERVGLGMAVGAAMGAALGALSYPSNGTPGGPGRGFAALVVGALGGAVGGLVGAASGGERWERAAVTGP